MKRTFLIIVTLTVILGLSAPPPAIAQSNPWTPLPGPSGGSVSALALSPNYAIDHTAYAGLRGGGVYRTLDGGISWHSVSDWTAGDRVVVDLALTPDFGTPHAGDGALFVTSGLWTTGYAVRRSTDQGKSWENVTPTWSTLPDPPQVVISPAYANDQTLYVLGGAETYRSTNGGDDFIQLDGWYATHDVVALALSPDYAADQALFALLADGELYKSEDGGTSWDPAGPAGLMGGLSAVALSPNYANEPLVLAVAAASGTLYTSPDGGATWDAGAVALDPAGEATLCFSPTFAGDGVILAASSADPGAYRSADGGIIWEPVGWYDPAEAYKGGFIGGGVYVLGLAPSYAWDAAAFAGTSSGVYRSQNRGVNWWQDGDGLPHLTIRALAVAPWDPDTLLAGTAFFENQRFDTSIPVETDGNLHLSTDRGQTWRHVTGRLEQAQNVAFSPAFEADSTAFATAGTIGQHGYYGGGIYRSTDGGENWEEVLGDHYAGALALHPNYPLTPTVWAATYPYSSTATLGMIRSVDGGESWQPLTTTIDAQVIVPSPNFSVDQTLFAGAADGLWRSTDGDLNWTWVLTGPVTALALSPAYGASQTAVAAAQDNPAAPAELYRSTDGGQTWTRLDSGIPETQDAQVRSIPRISYAHDGALVAAVDYGDAGGGVYRSTDGGDTWQAVGDPLYSEGVLALASTAGRALTLYAGAADGLWQRELAQGGPAEPGTWRSAGPRGGRVRTLALSPAYEADGVALAGDWRYEGASIESGRGIYRSSDGGQSWSSASAGVDYGSAIHAYAFSPAYEADRTVFAASGGGLYRSTDGGTSWSWTGRLYSGPPGWIYDVAAAPDFATSGHVMAISGWGGLHYSQDGGINWTTRLTVSATSALAYSPAFEVDGTAFAGGWDLWRTVDRGTSWTRVLTESISTIAVSPHFESDGTLFAGAGELYISGDRGVSWISVTLPSAPIRIHALALSPAYEADSTLYVGMNDGLYRSEDGGFTWAAVESWPGLAVHALALSPNWPTHTVMLAGTDQGVYRTTDGGATWARSEGLDLLKITSLSPSVQGDRLLAGAGRYGLYLSQGEEWAPFGLQGMTSYRVADAALSPAYPGDGTAWAALNSSISIGGSAYRTTDSGASWEMAYSTDYLGAVAPSPRYASDRTLYLTGAGGEVLRSTDGGETWTPVGTWPGGTYSPAHLVVLPPNYPADGTIFAGGPEGFWRLPAGATVWEPAASGLISDTYVTAIAVSPHYVTDTTLLATASWQEAPSGPMHYGVYRSTDGGQHWALSNAGLPDGPLGGIAFSPHFAFDQMAYVPVEDALYRSLDGGASWTAVGAPPEGSALGEVVAAGGGEVHVATSAGVRRYDTRVRDAVVNGGFEGQGGWTLSDTAYPAAYASGLSYGGTRSMRVGIDNGANTPSYAWVRQVITVPVDAVSVTLGCHIYSASSESTQIGPEQVFAAGLADDGMDAAAGEGDAQYLLLLDPETDEILEVLFWELASTGAWEERTYDLGAYAGRAAVVAFGAYNDGTGGRTAMYADGVSLLVDRPWPYGAAHRVYAPLVFRVSGRP
jgi:photosystem II stability/assembly factor-like uncharacterized protein